MAKKPGRQRPQVLALFSPAREDRRREQQPPRLFPYGHFTHLHPAAEIPERLLHQLANRQRQNELPGGKPKYEFGDLAGLADAMA